ncbi:MAG: hypothetical protein QM760_15095 [Nibricoccus sp.]
MLIQSQRVAVYGCCVMAGSLFLNVGTARGATYAWQQGTGNWSTYNVTGTTPGWTSTTGYPNASSAFASFSTSGTTTQDVTGGVTVGAIKLGSINSNTRSVSQGGTSGSTSFGVTFNNGGTNTNNSYGNGAIIQSSATGSAILSFGGTGRPQA